ncbi:hypothetical protein [Aliarcobacter butzleri]|uniref:hypothetical protein n=1 Tax=Aliarcobacter butzleri TaxID=28197 RepID=UPI00263CAA05|nr:hypothetical protein [Aliarcobacter butzleri]MDN5095481.1 hypothetical protein [Aliarcobacter butzleri]
MKKVTLIGIALATTLFTGCAGGSFKQLVDKQLGVPQSKQEMVAQNSDKEMATAFSVLLDPSNQAKKDRTIDVRGVKDGSIELSAYNFIRYTDKINSDKYNELYLTLIENSQPAKIFVDVATKRGNKVKAYKGSINYIVFGDDINTYRLETNGVSYQYTTSPTYIEFDSNNKIVSIMAYMAETQFQSNLPKSELTKDLTFFIVTGAKAKSKQEQLTNKYLEDCFLFNVN